MIYTSVTDPVTQLEEGERGAGREGEGWRCGDSGRGIREGGRGGMGKELPLPSLDKVPQWQGLSKANCLSVAKVF